MNASLSVELVPVEAQPQVDAAVETERESGRNVAVSYTFDIKVLDLSLIHIFCHPHPARKPYQDGGNVHRAELQHD